MSGSAAHSEDLAAPLYVAWQITNECNFACLHCIEESGPGKAFADELGREEVLGVIDQLMDNEVPYLSFSGGEPMLHPHFFEMVERVTTRGSQLKIETNGHYLTPENCARLKDLGVKAVQVSLDGASSATFGRMRVLGQFDRTVSGIRNLAAAGVPIEVNFSPASFNIHEAERIVDFAFELGAASFYSGRTMFTGNAVKAWRHLSVTDDQYAEYFQTLAVKRLEYRGRMQVNYHEAGLLEELRYRLEHPAALLIVLPNGLVKLINALPFICGDLRKESLAEVWANFRRAWHDPRVVSFVDELAVDPERTRTLHKWVHV
ncbi:radical SAM protein [Usitatibacter palustris]|uniref:PqqA peptide cyclase n=1 Tax=Usitatibacter palustris TaxID=2732487 RepID=A0A6M4HAY3_9PROT|nr:radical SAM protein [Usitatibacter palustris]QJR15614.1 PqqA peptide cyclase [Usitatibacter palustris]